MAEVDTQGRRRVRWMWVILFAVLATGVVIWAVTSALDPGDVTVQDAVELGVEDAETIQRAPDAPPPP